MYVALLEQVSLPVCENAYSFLCVRVTCEKKDYKRQENVYVGRQERKGYKKQK